MILLQKRGQLFRLILGRLEADARLEGEVGQLSEWTGLGLLVPEGVQPLHKAGEIIGKATKEREPQARIDFQHAISIA